MEEGEGRCEGVRGGGGGMPGHWRLQLYMCA